MPILSMSSLHSILLLPLISMMLSLVIGSTDGGFCSAPSTFDEEEASKSLYWKVTNPTLSPSHLQDLPGFTRSVYKRDHALITPESHDQYLRSISNHTGYGLTLCYVLSKDARARLHPCGYNSDVSRLNVFFLGDGTGKSRSGLPPHDVERFIFVVQGSVTLTNASSASHKLMVDSYAYLPPNFEHLVECDGSATLAVFERRYAFLDNLSTELIVGSTDKQPLLETPGEVFELRKLLPPSLPYDFNIHIMDFQPGEYLNVKEVHYNQHGLLLLEGHGIYRLGDSWYPVQSGDVIWMAPFVPQWYAALGKTRSRYLLYKDVNRNPL